MSGEDEIERNRRIAIAVNAMTGMADDETFVPHFTDDAVWHLNRRTIHGHEGLSQISARAREACITCLLIHAFPARLDINYGQASG